MISTILRVKKVCKWPSKAAQTSLAQSHFKAADSENIFFIRGELEDMCCWAYLFEQLLRGFMLDCNTAQKNGQEIQTHDPQAF